MKNTLANVIRERYLDIIMSYFSDEDAGKTASNSFNFLVVEGGKENWVEIVVKVSNEDGYNGYTKRNAYRMRCKKRAEQEKDVLGTTLCTYCGSNERKVYNHEPKTIGLADTNKYYKTFCPSCGHEGSIFKQSYNEKHKQERE